MTRFHLLRRSIFAACLVYAAFLALIPAAAHANLQTVAGSGLGDGEVCGSGVYLGRIETGGGYVVGQQVSVGDFTIEVTSTKDGGEITGFIVVAGGYDYLVIHAGDGSATFGDPSGPFDHGLSFVAFCAALAEPTATNTVVPTATITPEPTATSTNPAPTETPGITPTVGGVTEVPSETATIPVTVVAVAATPRVDPTQTPDDLVKPGGLPVTGAGPGPGGIGWLAGLITFAAGFGAMGWQIKRNRMRA
jgi:hypothetical protein